MAEKKAKYWPWYIAGPLLAVLTVLSLYLFHDTIGLGETLTMASEYCVESVESKRLEAPPMDWRFGLLAGIFIGALAAALLSGDLKPKFFDASGSGAVNILQSILGAVLGGFAVMTGIQLSGDSVLGHIASGMQLSGAAWVFLVTMSVSGIVLGGLLSQRGGGKTTAGSGKTAAAPAKKKSAVPAKKAAAKGKKA